MLFHALAAQWGRLVHGSSMSPAISAWRWRVCVQLNLLYVCPCQSAWMRWVNKSGQGFSKAVRNLITKEQHLAPMQLPSVNEAQSILWVAHPLCRRFCTYTVSTKQHGPLFGRCEAVYLCCCVDWWGGWGRGRGMMWIVGVLLWKEVFPPRRRLTEFDKAVSAERL